MSVEQAVMAALITVTLLMLRAQVGIARQTTARVRLIGAGLPRLLLVAGLVMAIRRQTQISIPGGFLVASAAICVLIATDQLFPCGIRFKSLPPDLLAALRPVPALVLIGSCTSSMTAAVVGLVVWAPLIRRQLVSPAGPVPPEPTSWNGSDSDALSTVKWRQILTAMALAGITTNLTGVWQDVLLLADVPLAPDRTTSPATRADNPSVPESVRLDGSAIDMRQPQRPFVTRPFVTGHLVVLCLLILTVSLSQWFASTNQEAQAVDDRSQNVEP